MYNLLYISLNQIRDESLKKTSFSLTTIDMYNFDDVQLDLSTKISCLHIGHTFSFISHYFMQSVWNLWLQGNVNISSLILTSS